MTRPTHWVLVLGVVLLCALVISAVWLLLPRISIQARVLSLMPAVSGELDHIGRGGTTPALDEVVSYCADSVPALILWMANHDEHSAMDAMSCLRRIGTPAAHSVPALRSVFLRAADQRANWPAFNDDSLAGLISSELVEMTRAERMAGYALTTIATVDPSLEELPELAARALACGVDGGSARILEQHSDRKKAVAAVRREIMACDQTNMVLINSYVALGGELELVESTIRESIAQSSGMVSDSWGASVLADRPRERLKFIAAMRNEISAGEAGLRNYVVRHLHELGPGVVAELQDWLSHETPDTRMAALHSAVALGEGAQALVPQIAMLIRQRSQQAFAGCAALTALGPRGVDQLAELACDEDRSVSTNAARALKCYACRIGPDVVPVMVTLLASAEGMARDEVAYFFRDNPDFHGEIESVLGDLELLLDSEDEMLAGYAFWIICKRRYGVPGVKAYDQREYLLRRAAEEDACPAVRSMARERLSEL